MKTYWLWTDNPENIDVYGLAIVKYSSNTDAVLYDSEIDDELDRIEVIKPLFISDPLYDGEIKKDAIYTFYDDALTEDPYRIIPFLFDKKYW